MKLLLNPLAWERFQAALSDARLRAVEEGGLVVWGDSDESFHVENSRPRMAHDVRIVTREGRTETWHFDVEPDEPLVPKDVLEHLRTELREGRISYAGLATLQSLAAHIAPDDVELLEAAGVPEFEDPGNLPESLCTDGSVAVYGVTQ